MTSVDAANAIIHNPLMSIGDKAQVVSFINTPFQAAMTLVNGVGLHQDDREDLLDVVLQCPHSSVHVLCFAKDLTFLEKHKLIDSVVTDIVALSSACIYCDNLSLDDQKWLRRVKNLIVSASRKD